MRFVLLFTWILIVSQVFGQENTHFTENSLIQGKELEMYVTRNVEKKMAEWSQKKEFESTLEFEERLKTKTDEQKQEYVHEVLMKRYGDPWKEDIGVKIGEYNEKEEYFPIESNGFGQFKLFINKGYAQKWKQGVMPLRHYLLKILYGVVNGKCRIVKVVFRDKGNDVNAIPFDESGNSIKFYWQDDKWNMFTENSLREEKTDEMKDSIQGKSEIEIMEMYVIEYVKQHIAEWEIKKEYEKTTEWEQRIANKKDEKIAELVHEALKRHYGGPCDIGLRVEKYDADNECLILKTAGFGKYLLYIEPDIAQNWLYKYRRLFNVSNDTCFCPLARGDDDYKYGIVEGKIGMVNFCISPQMDKLATIPLWFDHSAYPFNADFAKAYAKVLIDKELPYKYGFPKYNFALWYVNILKKAGIVSGMSGKIKFTVKKNGRVSNLEVIPDPLPASKKQAKMLSEAYENFKNRIIRALINQQWLPAVQNGNIVDQTFTLPFSPELTE